MQHFQNFALLLGKEDVGGQWTLGRSEGDLDLTEVAEAFSLVY